MKSPLKKNKIGLLWEEVRLLGFKGVLFRLGYEFYLRSGFGVFLDKNIGLADSSISLRDWLINRVPWKSFGYTGRELPGLLLSEQQKILNAANRAIEGNVLCFSHLVANYEQPINWFLNTQKKVAWPSDVHWTRVMKYEKECGDIKLAWEINRFPHVYDLVRAYTLTKDNKYIRFFCDQLKSWEEENPYGLGINWFNGQELAIRLFSWIFAVYSFSEIESFFEEDFQRFLRLLYLHSHHIEKNISYAYYAVHNNHLIGEALALYISGMLFPYFSESERWRKKGKKILESKKCLEQFYVDGGYCQLSHNYHRLALHYYIWAVRVADLNGDKFCDEVYELLDKSSRFLYSNMNLSDGRLPNWGANDGALLNPWTNCDYSDFRPVVQTLSYLTRGKKAFESGPWDEELSWFFGREALDKEVVPYEQSSVSYKDTGIHVIRKSKEDFVVFRCGSIKDRFGQADQLHVDLWWKGLNIAIDGGSYLYNDEMQYHKYFMGTKSHNTVTVNGKDQMYLHRRFKWLYWTQAKLLEFRNNYVEGEHYGYLRDSIGVVHKRSIQLLDNGGYLIKDFMQGSKDNTYELHWLLNDYDFEVLEETDSFVEIKLITPKGDYYLKLESNCKAGLTVVRAKDDVEYPDGWQSRFYAEKLPALSVRLSCELAQGCEFSSLFYEKN